MDEAVHEGGVEAVFSLNLEGHAQQLVVEDFYVGVRVVLEHLQHAVRAHQVLLEEVRLLAQLVRKQV